MIINTKIADRHWRLARFEQPTADEMALVALAKCIDPLAWFVRMHHAKRLHSLEAAARVQVQIAAEAAMRSVGSQPSFFARMMSLLRLPPAKLMRGQS